MVDTQFPYLFALAAVGLMLGIVWTLLWSSNVFAKIVSRLLSWMVLPDNESLKIDSIGFATLGGQLFFRRVEYRTKDACVMVLQATVTLAWWETDVRDGKRINQIELPFRLVLQLVGVEVMVYNHSARVEQLLTVVKMQQKRKKGPNVLGAGLVRALSLSLGQSWMTRERRPSHIDQADTINTAAVIGALTWFPRCLLACVTHVFRAGRSALAFANDATPEERAKAEAEERLYEALPWFYRICPATKIEVEDSAVYIGHTSLRTSLVMHFSRLECIHHWQTVADTNQADLYQLQTKSILKDVRMFFRANHFEASSKNRGDHIDVVNSVKNSYNDLKTDMNDIKAVVFEEGNLESHSHIMRRRKTSLGSSESRSMLLGGKAFMVESGPLSALAQAGEPEHCEPEWMLRMLRGVEVAKSTSDMEVFTCARMQVLLRMDVADVFQDDPVPTILDSPQKLVDVTFFTKATFVVSGEYLRYARALLRHFAPADYQHRQVFEPMQGDFRASLKAFAKVVFERELCVRAKFESPLQAQRVIEGMYHVPFVQQPSDLDQQSDAAADKLNDQLLPSGITPDLVSVLGDCFDAVLKGDAESIDMETSPLAMFAYPRYPACFDVVAESGGIVDIGVPLLPLSTAGTTTSVKVNFSQLKVIPSFTLQPLLSAAVLSVNLQRTSPLQWNATHSTTCDVTVDSPQINLLHDHITAAQELALFWSAFATATQVQHFVPEEWTCNLSVIKPSLRLIANEHNVVDCFDVIESMERAEYTTHNAFVVVEMRELNISARGQQLQFGQELQTASIEVGIQSGLCRLLLPKSIADVQRRYNSGGVMIEAPFCVFKSVQLKLDAAHNSKPPAGRTEACDMLNVDLRVGDCDAKLSGHLIRYLLAVQQNYAGRHTHFIPTSRFAKEDGFRNSFAELCTKKWRDLRSTFVSSGLHANPADGRFGNRSFAPSLHVDKVDSSVKQREVYLLFTLTGLSVRLPRYLHIDTKAPTLRCFEVQVEMRALQQYIDVTFTAAPITLIVPLVEKSDHEFLATSFPGRTPHIRFGDSYVSLHLVRGFHNPVVYKMNARAHLTELSGFLMPSQVLTMYTAFSVLGTQYRESVDIRPWLKGLVLLSNEINDSNLKPLHEVFGCALDDKNVHVRMPDLVDASEPSHRLNWMAEILECVHELRRRGWGWAGKAGPGVNADGAFIKPGSTTEADVESWGFVHALTERSVEYSVGPIELSLVHSSAVSRLTMLEGMQCHASSFITASESHRAVIDVPDLQLHHLLPRGRAESINRHEGGEFDSLGSALHDAEQWRSVFHMQSGWSFLFAIQRSDGATAAQRQRDFIFDATQRNFQEQNDDSATQNWHDVNVHRTISDESGAILFDPAIVDKHHDHAHTRISHHEVRRPDRAYSSALPPILSKGKSVSKSPRMQSVNFPLVVHHDSDSDHDSFYSAHSDESDEVPRPVTRKRTVESTESVLVLPMVLSTFRPSTHLSDELPLPVLSTSNQLDPFFLSDVAVAGSSHGAYVPPAPLRFCDDIVANPSILEPVSSGHLFWQTDRWTAPKDDEIRVDSKLSAGDGDLFRLTNRVHIENTQAVQMLVAPAFFASLDGVFEILCPKTCTVDDMLDNLHRSCANFSDACAPFPRPVSASEAVGTPLSVLILEHFGIVDQTDSRGPSPKLQRRPSMSHRPSMMDELNSVSADKPLPVTSPFAMFQVLATDRNLQVVVKVKAAQLRMMFHLSDDHAEYQVGGNNRQSRLRRYSTMFAHDSHSQIDAALFTTQVSFGDIKLAYRRDLVGASTSTQFGCVERNISISVARMESYTCVRPSDNCSMSTEYSVPRSRVTFGMHDDDLDPQVIVLVLQSMHKFNAEATSRIDAESQNLALDKRARCLHSVTNSFISSVRIEVGKADYVCSPHVPQVAWTAIITWLACLNEFRSLLSVSQLIHRYREYSILSEVLQHACVSGDKGNDTLIRQYFMWTFDRQGLPPTECEPLLARDMSCDDFVLLVGDAVSDAKPFSAMLRRFVTQLPSVQQQRLLRKINTLVSPQALMSMRSLVNVVDASDKSARSSSTRLRSFIACLREFAQDADASMTAGTSRARVNAHSFEFDVGEVNFVFVENDMQSAHVQNTDTSDHLISIQQVSGSLNLSAEHTIHEDVLAPHELQTNWSAVLAMSFSSVEINFGPGIHRLTYAARRVMDYWWTKQVPLNDAQRDHPAQSKPLPMHRSTKSGKQSSTDSTQSRALTIQVPAAEIHSDVDAGRRRADSSNRYSTLGLSNVDSLTLSDLLGLKQSMERRVVDWHVQVAMADLLVHVRGGIQTSSVKSTAARWNRGCVMAVEFELHDLHVASFVPGSQQTESIDDSLFNMIRFRLGEMRVLRRDRTLAERLRHRLGSPSNDVASEVILHGSCKGVMLNHVRIFDVPELGDSKEFQHSVMLQVESSNLELPTWLVSPSDLLSLWEPWSILLASASKLRPEATADAERVPNKTKSLLQMLALPRCKFSMVVFDNRVSIAPLANVAFMYQNDRFGIDVDCTEPRALRVQLCLGAAVSQTVDANALLFSALAKLNTSTPLSQAPAKDQVKIRLMQQLPPIRVALSWVEQSEQLPQSPKPAGVESPIPSTSAIASPSDPASSSEVFMMRWPASRKQLRLPPLSSTAENELLEESEPVQVAAQPVAAQTPEPIEVETVLRDNSMSFAELSVDCSIGAVTGDMSTESMQHLVHLQQLLGSEITSMVDSASEIVLKFTGSKAQTDQTKGSDKPSHDFDLQISYLHFGLIFEGLHLRFATFNRNDPYLMFSSGACRLNVSHFPLLDGAKLGEFMHVIEKPEKRRLKKRRSLSVDFKVAPDHHSSHSGSSHSSRRLKSVQNRVQSVVPDSIHRRLLTLIELARKGSSKQKLGQDDVNIWSAEGLCSIMVLSCTFDDLLLQLAPSRDVLDDWITASRSLCRNSFFHIKTNVELQLVGRVPNDVASTIRAQEISDTEDAPEARTFDFAVCGIQSTRDLLSTAQHDYRTEASVSTRTANQRQMQIHVTANSTQVLLDPAFGITASSFADHVDFSTQEYNRRVKELVSSGVVNYEPLFRVWHSFQVTSNMSKIQTELLRKTDGFYVHLSLRAHNLRSVLRCKTGAAMSAIHAAGTSAASTQTFAPSALICNLDSIEATASRAPQEKDAVESVGISELGAYIGDSAPSEFDKNHDDPAYQTVAFSVQSREVRLLYSEVGDDENSVPGPQGWAAWERSGNRVSLSNLVASGNGSVHQFHVRLAATAVASGPRVLIDARFGRLIFETQEALDNMILSWLYKYSHHTSSSAQLRDSEDDLIAAYPFLAKRLDISLSASMESGECMVCSTGSLDSAEIFRAKSSAMPVVHSSSSNNVLPAASAGALAALESQSSSSHQSGPRLQVQPAGTNSNLPSSDAVVLVSWALPAIELTYLGMFPTMRILFDNHNVVRSKPFLGRAVSNTLDDERPEHLLLFELSESNVSFTPDILIFVAQIQDELTLLLESTEAARRYLEVTHASVVQSTRISSDPDEEEFQDAMSPRAATTTISSTITPDSVSHLLSPDESVVLFAYLARLRIHASMSREQNGAMSDIGIGVGIGAVRSRAERKSNLTISIRVQPSSATLTCAPADERVSLVLEHQLPLFVFITSTYVADPVMSESPDSPIRLVCVNISCGDMSGTLRGGPSGSTFLTSRLGSAKVQVTEARGLCRRLPLRCLLVHAEQVQTNINASHLRTWAAFELSWIAKFYHYHGSGSSTPVERSFGHDDTASNSDEISGDNSSQSPSTHNSKSRHRWRVLGAHVNGELFDVFTMSRVSDVYVFTDFTQLASLATRGPLVVRSLDWNYVQRNRGGMGGAHAEVIDEEHVTRFGSSIEDLLERQRDCEISLDVSARLVQYELRPPTPEGLDLSFSCAQISSSIERLPIGDEGRRLDLWNRRGKYARNWCKLELAPTRLDCATSRTPQLLRVRSDASVELLLDDMVNLEYASWETAVEVQQVEGRLMAALSADSIVFWRTLIIVFGDAINTARASVIEQLAMSWAQFQSQQQSGAVRRSVVEADGFSSAMRPSREANVGTAFGFSNAKTTENTLSVKQQEHLAKDAALGSVTLLGNRVEFDFHGDGQDRSWIHVAMTHPHIDYLQHVPDFHAEAGIELGRLLTVNIRDPQRPAVAKDASSKTVGKGKVSNSAPMSMVISYLDGDRDVMLSQFASLTLKMDTILSLGALRLTGEFHSFFEDSVIVESNPYIFKNFKRIGDLYARKRLAAAQLVLASKVQSAPLQRAAVPVAAAGTNTRVPVQQQQQQQQLANSQRRLAAVLTLMESMPWLAPWHSESNASAAERDITASNGDIKLQIDTTNGDVFSFRPQLSATGDFVPTVDWILAQQLDIKPITIAEGVHSRVGGSMESLIRHAGGFSAWLDSIFD